MKSETMDGQVQQTSNLWTVLTLGQEEDDKDVRT